MISVIQDLRHSVGAVNEQPARRRRAALAVRAPLAANGGGAQMEVLPQATAAPAGQGGYATNFTWVDPRYFAVMGTRVLAGRAFNDQDGPRFGKGCSCQSDARKPVVGQWWSSGTSCRRIEYVGTGPGSSTAVSNCRRG
jgi:hypothetical protein